METSMNELEPVVVRGDSIGVCTLYRGCGEDEPRVRDLDLGEWLEFERARDVRKLIQRHLPSLGEVSRHRGAKPSSPTGGRPEEVYYLTEAQALFIVAKSETEKATAVLQQVIAVYLAWRRGAVAVMAPDWKLQQEARRAEMDHMLEMRRLDLERERLDHDRRQAKSAALTQLLQHPLLAAVGDEIKRAHLITSVELAVGMSLPALRPSAAHIEGWLSPTDIARQTGFTPQAVGLAISRVWGRRRAEVPGRSKAIINTARNGEKDGVSKTVISYLYAPAAVEQIIAALSKKAA